MTYPNGTGENPESSGTEGAGASPYEFPGLDGSGTAQSPYTTGGFPAGGAEAGAAYGYAGSPYGGAGYGEGANPAGYANPVPPGVGDPYLGAAGYPGAQGVYPGTGGYPGYAGYPGQPAAMVPAIPGYGYVPAGYQPKSYVAAALLAFFLGGLGVHNFYLGYTTRAIWQLVLYLVGIVLSFVLVGLPIIIGVGIWAFVEFILILLRSGSYGHDANGVPLV